MMTDVLPQSDTTTPAPLQMLRAEVNVQEFHRWAGLRRLQDPDHAMHCLLKETFGELAPKPFRLIAPRAGSRGCLYGYGRGAGRRLAGCGPHLRRPAAVAGAAAVEHRQQADAVRMAIREAAGLRAAGPPGAQEIRRVCPARLRAGCFSGQGRNVSPKRNAPQPGGSLRRLAVPASSTAIKGSAWNCPGPSWCPSSVPGRFANCILAMSRGRTR